MQCCQLHHPLHHHRLTSSSSSRRCVKSAAAASAKQVPRTPAPADLLAVEQSHGLWQRGVHFVASEVRDYELDQFQVVNNAVYASYVQYGRHKAFSSLGISVSSLQQAGTLMALSDLSLKYKSPLRSGDVFFITTAVAQLTAARLVLDHTVQLVTGQPGDPTHSTQVVCQGNATVVFLDQIYRPVRMPAGLKQALTPLRQEYEQQQQDEEGSRAAS